MSESRIAGHGCSTVARKAPCASMAAIDSLTASTPVTFPVAPASVMAWAAPSAASSQPTQTPSRPPGLAVR